jgi:antitoxin (DNA-binding transcriptional repressor) of toxin-antitoxin stability system
MATTVNVYEAKTRLSALLAMAEGGEEVIIARNGRPIAMLGPLPRRQTSRAPGLLRGKIEISPDFDEFTNEDAVAWYGNPVE